MCASYRVPRRGVGSEGSREGVTEGGRKERWEAERGVKERKEKASRYEGEGEGRE